jgi:hypothetical protein
MVKPTRSPLLGYNHNIKYKGRIYHVQTEDSGPSNPHLFTHLYYEGTILATKRQEYDGAAPDDNVKALMQAQHKAIMKDLKRGDLDGKLGMFFGSRGEPVDPGEETFETGPGSFASSTPTAPDAPLPEVVAFDLDTPPPSLGDTPLPEPVAAVALPTAGPGIYAMKRATIERAPLGEHYQGRPAGPRTGRSTSEALLPLVIFDPPGTATPAPQRRINTPPPVSMGTPTRARPPAAVLTPPPQPRSTAQTPPPVPVLGQTPPPVPAQARRPSPPPGNTPVPVVVQRTVGVGSPSTPSSQAARPRRPQQNVPYVVKEGTHAMGDGQIAPPRPLVPPQGVSPRTSASTPASPVSEPISDKSLDEVILAYLSQGDGSGKE